MPFLLAEILNFQGSTHRIGVGSFSGLLENEMILSTSAMKIEMKINKVVANNSWVKDNLNYLKSKNYFYHQ